MRQITRPTYVTWVGNPYMIVKLTGFEPGEVSDNLLPLDALRGLPKQPPRAAGVYFLWRGPQLLYIGSTSDDLLGRVDDHRRTQLGLRLGMRFPFTHSTSLEHKGFGERKLEYDYIEAYRPPFNPQTRYTGWGHRSRQMNAHYSSPNTGDRHGS